jgi:hypothetical protein
MYYFIFRYLHSWSNDVTDGRERKMVKYIITLKPNLMMDLVSVQLAGGVLVSVNSQFHVPALCIFCYFALLL